MPEQTTSPYDIRLMVSGDRLKVFLSCTIPEEKMDEFLGEIEKELKVRKLANCPSRSDLDVIFAAAKSRGLTELNDFVLIKGIEATAPVNDELVWAGDFFKTGYAIDEKTGQINYKVHLSKPSVESGQLLATITLAQPGKDGMDVMGKVIVARKPERVRLLTGHNVESREEPNCINFYATSGGRVELRQNKLNVENVYEIHGDVTMEVGNISHTGTVIVHGDVQAGFEIQAGGDLIVDGLIESSNIVCGGNLSVQAGITGCGKDRRVVVAGTVQARFINESLVVAGGDVMIETEAIQSCIVTRQKILSPHGKIIGGSVKAFRGIEVAQVGSPSGIRTDTIVGVDDLLEKKIGEILKQIEPIEAQVKKLEEIINFEKPRMNRLPAAQREALTEKMFEHQQLLMAKDQILKQVEELKGESYAEAGKELDVLMRVYPDTHVRIRDASLVVNNSLNGPLEYKLLSDGKIHL